MEAAGANSPTILLQWIDYVLYLSNVMQQQQEMGHIREEEEEGRNPQFIIHCTVQSIHARDRLMLNTFTSSNP